jgi:hypothetical protein
MIVGDDKGARGAAHPVRSGAALEPVVERADAGEKIVEFMIAEQDRLAWQATTGYGRRSLVETIMGRYKSLIGPRLRAHGFAGQQTEAAIGVE